ncbi:MAG TPA: 16S rRNA (cytidine(1402)-2'-O)-methyltransferase [Syntrophomonadaceae bacterium]|nr:16S rRNA (cytidine(1402)-2'-O)-methyltransferase [Syntrophomonadaceae bacterium]
MAKLYVCATPIGNLEDVSLRLLRIFREVDLIACEDTRHTSKLLNHYQIKNRLISYHGHSEGSREDKLLDALEQGKSIALVSDAGMPGISDPGAGLIGRAIEAHLEIEVVPGPSALIAALALSGFDSSSFVFEGFLARRGGKRLAQLENLKEESRTIILYEAPHRLLDTLSDIEKVMGGERQVAVARELTKKFEEVRRGTVSQVKAHFEETAPRGEICLVISGAGQKEIPSLDEVVEEIRDMVNQGMNKKEALKLKARQYNIPKTQLYKHLVDQEKRP